MNDAEIIQHTVAVLTQAEEVKRLLIEDPDRDDETLDDAVHLISNLVSDVLRAEVVIPQDATPAETAALVVDALGPTFHRLVASFAWAFRELAEVHDAGEPEESSAEVLRRWALQAEQD